MSQHDYDPARPHHKHHKKRHPHKHKFRPPPPPPPPPIGQYAVIAAGVVAAVVLVLTLSLYFGLKDSSSSPSSSPSSGPGWVTSPLLSTCVEDSSTASNPSCFSNGVGCAPPSWPVEWNLTMSTIGNPGGGSGYWLPPAGQVWGLLSLDWGTASSIWDVGGLMNATVEATLTTNCRMIKELSPGTRCFIYHNNELALEVLESQRKVMYNPTYASYFLDLANSDTIYDDYSSSAGDEYLWDFRNPNSSEYFINSILQVLNDPNVDGTYLDDYVGAFDEHYNAASDTGLDTTQLQAPFLYCKQVAQVVLLDALIANGKYPWTALSHGGSGGNEDALPSAISSSGCQVSMTLSCGAAYQNNANVATAITFDGSAAIQSIAAFLILRGPYAWLGSGWNGGGVGWSDYFLLQVGEPQGVCVQSPSGVFTRQWTYGAVTLDCNTWTASIAASSGTVTS